MVNITGGMDVSDVVSQSGDMGGGEVVVRMHGGVLVSLQSCGVGACRLSLWHVHSLSPYPAGMSPPADHLLDVAGRRLICR